MNLRRWPDGIHFVGVQQPVVVLWGKPNADFLALAAGQVIGWACGPNSTACLVTIVRLERGLLF